MPVTHLHAEELLLPRIKTWQPENLVVVAPDAGSLKRAQRYALALNVPMVAIAKERPRPDAAAPLQLLGEAKDRTCLIVDDLVSTGRTLAGAAESLRQGGARDVYVIFTHPVMGQGAVERLFAAQVSKALTTDSIPVTADAWLEVVTIAPLLARAVRELREFSSGPEAS
jgi:ribose-phosphate pyrophosphokinase